MIALGAFQQPSLHGPITLAPASGATKAFGPPQLDQVSAAVLLAAEGSLELGKRSRVVFHAADTLPLVVS